MFSGILIELKLNAFVLTILYYIYKDSPAAIGSVHDIWLTNLFQNLSTQSLDKISLEVPETLHTNSQCTSVNSQ